MRGIEQIPSAYDAMMFLTEAFGLRRWREWLVAGARGRTLDVGCGTGRNLPLYGTGTAPIGLDPEEPALKVAKRRAPGVPLVRASAHALPFKAEVFDTVVSGFTFCSVPDARTGLAEVRRVLRHDGTLRMLEHVRSTSEVMAKLQDVMQPAWTFVTGGCHPNRATEASVEASGFEILSDGRRAKNNMRRFAARKA